MAFARPVIVWLPPPGPGTAPPPAAGRRRGGGAAADGERDDEGVDRLALERQEWPVRGAAVGPLERREDVRLAGVLVGKVHPAGPREGLNPGPRPRRGG